MCICSCLIQLAEQQQNLLKSCDNLKTQALQLQTKNTLLRLIYQQIIHIKMTQL